MMRYLWITLIVFIADQWTKIWVKAHLSLYEQWQIFPGFNLTFACNEGAAFSFLSQAGGWQRWLFAALAAVVSIVILVWLVKLPKHKTWLACGLAFILAGALGNLWDRVYLGCVVDFIQVYLSFLPWRLFNPWPSFNIADSAIFIGATLYLIDAFFIEKEEQNGLN